MEFESKSKYSKLKTLSNLEKGIIVVSLILLATIIPIIIISSSNNSSVLNDNQQNTLFNLEKIDNHPLYIMNYSGDYGFENYLKTGINYLSQDFLDIDWACTCFATLNNETDMLFGRNFDWSHNPILVLFTDPSYGYRSISIIDLGLLDLYNDYQISHNPQVLLRAPYFPLDGMNEHGLTIACMAISDAENVNDPEKKTLASLDFIRLALDYAKDVEEACDLWEDYNVYFPPGPDLHYLIADAGGNSAVIEWVDGEMKILRNENLWQVSTNFVIYGSTENEQQNCIRYITCESFLNEKKGNINESEALNLLGMVSQSITQWSAVYNREKRTVSIVLERNFDFQFEFTL